MTCDNIKFLLDNRIYIRSKKELGRRTQDEHGGTYIKTKISVLCNIFTDRSPRIIV